jgi:hypothetical protein
LPQQGATQQRLGVERRPRLGLLFLANGQAFAQQRFGVSEHFCLQQH